MSSVLQSLRLFMHQVFLSPSLAVRGKGPGALAERHGEMARILSRRHARIDAVHALTLIPSEVHPTTLCVTRSQLHGRSKGAMPIWELHLEGGRA